jgi:hypothetical protein
MPNLIPIVIIAVAGFLLLTQRDGRVALAAFFLQWVGIAWLVWISPSPAAGSPVATVELVVAASTTVVMGLTVFRIPQPHDRTYPPGATAAGRRARRSRSPGTRVWQPQDWILLWGLGLLAGVAGYGLARVNPLDIDEGDLLAFFWVALPAVLVLTIDSARSAVKLGLGLLSLLNSAFLLLYIAGIDVPPVGVLALSALVRIGLAMLLSYVWLAVGSRYETLNLNALFDTREGISPASSSLAIVELKDRGSEAEEETAPVPAEDRPEDPRDE